MPRADNKRNAVRCWPTAIAMICSFHEFRIRRLPKVKAQAGAAAAAGARAGAAAGAGAGAGGCGTL